MGLVVILMLLRSLCVDRIRVNSAHVPSVFHPFVVVLGGTVRSGLDENASKVISGGVGRYVLSDSLMGMLIFTGGR